MRRFEDRVAVVSGAAQGMGKAVALRLGAEGATVVAVDINSAGATATAQTIGGASLGVGCDIGDEVSVTRLFETVAGTFGKLDVLVNVAAIVPFVKWDELSFTEWRRVLRVNLDGLYLMCRAGSDLMRKGKYGRIVNFSSNSIFAGTPNMAHYVASKGGVIGLTKAFAREFAGQGITVNTIPPTIVDTPMARNAAGVGNVPSIDVMGAMVPSGRAGTPDDIAATCAFLCSDEASYITGQLIGVNGGMYI